MGGAHACDAVVGQDFDPIICAPSRKTGDVDYLENNRAVSALDSKRGGDTMSDHRYIIFDWLTG